MPLSEKQLRRLLRRYEVQSCLCPILWDEDDRLIPCSHVIAALNRLHGMTMQLWGRMGVSLSEQAWLRINPRAFKVSMARQIKRLPLICRDETGKWSRSGRWELCESDDYFERPPPPAAQRKSTRSERIAELVRRVESGQALFHPDEAPDEHDGSPRILVKPEEGFR